MSKLNNSKPRIAIFISGRGSNMVALVEAMQDGHIDAIPAIVIANRSDAKGISRATSLDVPCEVVCRDQFLKQRDFEEALIKADNEAKLKAALRPLDRYIILSWRVEKLQSQIKRRLTSPRLCYYKPPKDVLDAFPSKKIKWRGDTSSLLEELQQLLQQSETN